MSNSGLINYTCLSPNCNHPRNKPISKITIHHMAGNLTIEKCGELFANPSRQGSSNYGVGTDGRIGLYVNESDRAWTSSSPANDHMAVTIEVANNSGAPDWTVSDVAYNSLINLCVDICRRNGIKELNYTGDANGNLTEHRMFTATSCPGPYLHARMAQIASSVNAILNGNSASTTTVTTTTPVVYRVRDTVTKQWPPEVSGYNTADNNNGYAGNIGHAIDCVAANISGSSVVYKVHTIGGSWLPEVTGYNINDSVNGYAGNIGQPIDGFMIRSTNGSIVHYKVHTIGGGWLPEVTGYNTADNNNGYAGNFGQKIDAVAIRVETLVVVETEPVTQPEVIPEPNVEPVVVVNNEPVLEIHEEPIVEETKAEEIVTEPEAAVMVTNDEKTIPETEELELVEESVVEKTVEVQDDTSSKGVFVLIMECIIKILKAIFK